MKQAKIAVSFDDGRLDNVNVIEHMLAPNGIPATLYVTTGYVDGTCPEDRLPTDKPSMSVEDVIRLFRHPLVEIGMHGDMHLNEDWDIRNGREKLIKWLELDDDHAFGFASPSTEYPVASFMQSKDPLFTSEIEYLAMGTRITTSKKLRLLSRKAGRVIRSKELFQMAYLDTMMQDCQDRVIYRVPILKDSSSAQVISLLRACIRESKAVTLMFHSIGAESANDTWTWANEKFEAVCEFLCREKSTGRVELCTVMQLYRALCCPSEAEL